MIQARGRTREENQTIDFGFAYSGGFLAAVFLKALIGKSNLWTKPY